MIYSTVLMHSIMGLPEPYYEEGEGDRKIVIYHADCRNILPELPADSVDLVLTDPPYPGREDLFATSGLALLPSLVEKLPTLLFWPPRIPCPGTPMAVHIWHKAVPIHRSSEIGNVAGHQYERILSYHIGKRCRVYRVAAILPHFAACADEFTKHPTQKPLSLLLRLFADAPQGLVCDPYLGSGTTLVAAKLQGRPAIGIEIEEWCCEIAAKRLAQGVFEFTDPQPPDGQATP